MMVAINNVGFADSYGLVQSNRFTDGPDTRKRPGWKLLKMFFFFWHTLKGLDTKLKFHTRNSAYKFKNLKSAYNVFRKESAVLHNESRLSASGLSENAQPDNFCSTGGLKTLFIGKVTPCQKCIFLCVDYHFCLVRLVIHNA